MWLNIGSRLYNGKFGWQIQNHFSVVCYKFFFSVSQELNWIFWVFEYWFKALQCQNWSTNKKPFFSKTKPNLGTLKKLSLCFRFSYNFSPKSFKGICPIFWWLNIGSTLFNGKFSQRIQVQFSGKARQALKFSKNYHPILKFPITLSKP